MKKKIIVSENHFRLLFENDDLSYQEVHIKQLLETGDMNNIEIAVEISKGLNININRIVDEVYGLFLKKLKRPFYNVENIDVVEDLQWLFTHNNLDLYGLYLEVLPKSIGNLTGLFSLNLDYNQLKDLPESIGNLTNLTSLTASNNLLTILPESIGNLVNLEYLKLSHNNGLIFPDSIVNLKNLETLSIESYFEVSKEQIAKIKRLLPNVEIN
jgi:Leucine-rich repeat (LRR) protein